MPQRTGDDFVLLQAFREGEEWAFDKVFRNLFLPLTYFSNSIIKNEKEAEDIVQDCFVRLWKRRHALSHIPAIKAYCYKAVRNESLKFIQRKQKQNPLSLPEPDELTIERLIIASETASELWKLLDLLGPSQREVIRLHYFEGKPLSEIAGILGIDTETARKHRARALIALRKTQLPFS